MSVGSQIKKARLARNLTQKELADLVGVTKNTITNYERDYSSPKETVLYQLIHALHVDANFIFSDYLPGSPPAPLLSEDESELLRLYREADPMAQDMALETLRRYQRKKSTLSAAE